jgi:hypothetical protein
MKILFLIGATSRIRNFDEALTLLADGGDVIQLTGRLRKGSFDLPKSVEHPRITGRVNPTQRSDGWRDVVDLLRGARDYVRYFDPRYASATRLVRRAYEIAPTQWVLFCERHPWVKRHWHAVSRALALCEELIPPDPAFVEFIREERPDLVLVTPLVTFESYQTDYVKAAHALGVPIVFIPFSWDNLTNKGLIRIQPDRVIVWNDLQQREAIDLHGCAPGNVAVTGAARFDDFFARRPSVSREKFCAEYGLDPAHPVILYLGSSQLTGPNEMELVRRWMESIRGAADPRVRDANILFRPHPALRNSYLSVDYTDLARVGVSLNASRGADQDLFDSLHHAHAAVGLNTSAMLEAAIVGRPVHTLVIPGFDEGQIGTMHFHYLVEAYGGLATVARDFDEHQRQLAGSLQGEPALSQRSRDFAGRFLRPHGIDRKVSPLLAAEITRAGAIRKSPRPAAPFWHAPLSKALLAWLQRRRVTSHPTVDATVIGTSISLRAVRTALEEIQQGTAPVFVGPWNDTAGNELLYWIPFLRWVVATYGIPAERLIVVSRGGPRAWYGPLAQRYLDARTLFSPSDLAHWSHRTVPQSEQDHKQAVMSPFDSEIIERAARAFELSDYQVLHPSLLFRTVTRLRKDRALEQMRDVVRPARFDGASPSASQRPAPYAAVSLAFTSALPKSEENAAFLATLVTQLATGRDVVIVDGLDTDVAVPPSPRVRLLDVPAGADLREAQTQALAGAAAFVGAYGDLAVIAAFCGTAVLAYHDEKMPPDHAERLAAAAASAGWGAVTLERARRFKELHLPATPQAVKA